MAKKTNKLSIINGYFQTLSAPEYSGKVEEAIEKKDRELTPLRFAAARKYPNNILARLFH